MIANRLLTTPLQLVVAQLDGLLSHLAEIRLDGELVLGGRRNDASPANRAGFVDVVGVEQQSARGLCGTGSDAGARHHSRGCRL